MRASPLRQISSDQAAASLLLPLLFVVKFLETGIEAARVRVTRNAGRDRIENFWPFALRHQPGKGSKATNGHADVVSLIFIRQRIEYLDRSNRSLSALSRAAVVA
jgi:hypothetical protein